MQFSFVWYSFQTVLSLCFNKIKSFEITEGRLWRLVINLTEAPAQVLDVDLLLLHTRRLSDQTGIVVGGSIGGTHRVLVVTTAVNVADAPGGEGKVETWSSGNEVCGLRLSSSIRPASLAKTLLVKLWQGSLILCRMSVEFFLNPVKGHVCRSDS